MTEAAAGGRLDIRPSSPAREEELYRRLGAEQLVPLWTEIGDLMPAEPTARGHAHLWRWTSLLPLAELAGDLIPVERGGERRAIALANPGLGGRPFATPTLWAAIQYLNPGENAPEHRHSQHAFRFVVEGEGVWTVVNGDPVVMRRGDFLPQPGWNWHGHRNAATTAMAWLDGLDIPLQSWLESTFFEFGAARVDGDDAPMRSRSERLWAHPGLRPLVSGAPPAATPLLAYRWEHTDRALCEQLASEDDGHPATAEPGHAAVRYTNPATAGDALPTIRAEFHRFRPGASSTPRREVGSSVFQVFDGEADVHVGEATWRVGRGDLFVVPSWQLWAVRCDATGVDLFRFSDAPVYERLGLHREQVDSLPTEGRGGVP
jgi:gentisate 1,2-dioxygenase